MYSVIQTQDVDRNLTVPPLQPENNMNALYEVEQHRRAIRNENEENTQSEKAVFSQ